MYLRSARYTSVGCTTIEIYAFEIVLYVLQTYAFEISLDPSHARLSKPSHIAPSLLRRSSSLLSLFSLKRILASQVHNYLDLHANYIVSTSSIESK